VIVLTTVASRGNVVTKRCPDTGHFVGNHRRPDARAIDHDPPPAFAISNLSGHGKGVLRIINRLLGVGSTVDDLPAGFLQSERNPLFERVAAMVGTNGDDAEGIEDRGWGVCMVVRILRQERCFMINDTIDDLLDKGTHLLL
jgi:hypothetical protein